MIPMYCVHCRRPRPVYRTYQARRSDGSIVIQGSCPACGTKLFVPASSPFAQDIAQARAGRG